MNLNYKKRVYYENHKYISCQKVGVFQLGGDLPINRLGFGAMRITGQGIWGYPKNLEEAQRVLHKAIELGINFIDTAVLMDRRSPKNLLLKHFILILRIL